MLAAPIYQLVRILSKQTCQACPVRQRRRLYRRRLCDARPSRGDRPCSLVKMIFIAVWLVRQPREARPPRCPATTMSRCPCARSTSTCTCRRRTGWTAAWTATWRRPRHTSGRRCSGSRWTSWPRYRKLGVKAVLLAWDAETATGRPRVPNETVAAACRAHPDAFTGLGSVDPHKGEAAVAEVASIAALGLRGVKFHPSLQAFSPDDPACWPVYAACEQHGLLALFHTGTSGIGARQPGGQGIRIDFAHPLKLDPVAAAFPGLTVVAAHFGWPWHADLAAEIG